MATLVRINQITMGFVGGFAPLFDAHIIPVLYNDWAHSGSNITIPFPPIYMYGFGNDTPIRYTLVFQKATETFSVYNPSYILPPDAPPYDFSDNSRYPCLYDLELQKLAWVYYSGSTPIGDAEAYKLLPYSKVADQISSDLNSPDGTVDSPYPSTNPTPPYMEVGIYGSFNSLHRGLVAFSLFDDENVYAFSMSDSSYEAIFPAGTGTNLHQLASISCDAFDWSIFEDITPGNFYCYKWPMIEITLGLEDSIDDTLFQGIWAGARFQVFSNSQWMILGSLVDNVIFVINRNMTGYIRIDVVTDTLITDGYFFIDVEGTVYLMGVRYDGDGWIQLGNVPAYDPTGGGGGGGGGGGDIPGGDGGGDTTVVLDETGGHTLRAWPFTQDDHDFYVLSLGASVTLVLDLTTNQWSTWRTEGHPIWRASTGIGWDLSNVAGDLYSGIIWNIEGGERLDDFSADTADSRPIISVIRGLYPLRLRNALSCARATLSVSEGAPAAAGVGITLRTSDDFGMSWQNHGFILLDNPTSFYEISWPSIGLITAPGRIFEIEDTGYALRIDALDVDLGVEEGKVSASGRE